MLTEVAREPAEGSSTVRAQDRARGGAWDRRPERGGSLLLVIPALNEEGCIAEVIRRARIALPGADVLVVNDGSCDQTASKARTAGALVVSHPYNLGIGGAVQTGLKFARQLDYDYVLRIDGDGQHDPRDLDRMLSVLRAGDADCVVGSRFLGDAVKMELTLGRRLGIHLFANEVSLITGQRATDTTSGMVALNRAAVRLLASHMPQDYPEVESRILLHEAGLRTVEVPVEMGERLAGVSSITNWKSFYYAVKVSIAVLLTAIKKTPKWSPEVSDAGSTPVGGGAWTDSPARHDPARPAAQAP